MKPYGITSGFLEAMLNVLKNFFKFTASYNIYPNITQDFTRHDALRVYKGVTWRDW